MTPSKSNNHLKKIEVPQVHKVEVMSDYSRAHQDPSRDYYPLCIVWSPIPCLTWIFPFIGHLGIAASDGIINDFAGSYYIHKSKSNTAFGVITKYWKINPSKIRRLADSADEVDAWDRAIEKSSKDFEHKTHNLILNNCHAHVAEVLDSLELYGFKNWNTVVLIVCMMLFSRYATWPRLLFTWLPFLVILGIVITVSVLASPPS